ncbi:MULTISPECIES: ATP-binding protein [Streptomyces]|uniref:ATP-binding protein n=1 Tax=Streptomyces dengpaensis TaxID=2049881 RepID=A0ABM6SXJ4_9ACTN|nr:MULTISPECIES: ATP-binding protein [Streptomyces]AVH59344.1 ATP-binding protein [Streptomyces dengpaensis]PIB05288.1 ATP-binding protein [Streptomyces sp. HG99]
MASVIPSAPLGTDAAVDRLGLRAAAGPRPGAAAERRFRFELAAHPGSVALARRLARSRLSGWAVCEDTCDTAALVISELVTNAIVHTTGEHVVCELHDGDEVVRIAVRDEGCAPGGPCPSPQRPEEEHGRGLLLVAAVSRAWGVQDTGQGLLVWAELERTAEPERTADRHRTPDGHHTPDGPDAGTQARSDQGWTAARSDQGWTAARSDQGWTAARSDQGWTAARSDLGWSAKKPPADGRGAGTEASWGTGSMGVPPIERSRDWGRV